MGFEDLPDEYDGELLKRCWELLASEVDSSKVRLRATSDLVAAVKEIHPNPLYANYSADRLSGRVAGKTIGQDDGTVDVVVDVSCVHRDSDPILAEQLFFHEAMHVVIKQRGESLEIDDVRTIAQELGLALDIVGMASIAAEEARVEKEVRARFPDQPGPYRNGLEELGKEFRRGAEVAWNKYQDDDNVEDFYASVTSSFQVLVTASGYAAADFSATNVEVADVSFDPVVEQVAFGSNWSKLLALLMKESPAKTPTDITKLNTQVGHAAETVFDWLKDVGFSVVPKGDGVEIRVLNPLVWMINAFPSE